MHTLIRNGLLITSKGRANTSVGIHDGVIAGVYEPGQEPPADEMIDASNLAVLPGVIDMHSHHREGSEPGFEYKDTIYTSTQQCAAGGVTTSVGMPNVNPPPNSLDLLKRQFAIYERDAVVDWNFNPAPTIADEIPRMAEEGIAAFKIFMVVDTGRNYPHMPGIGVHDHGRILEIMQQCAKVNVPLMVHPHDQALMDVIEKDYWERQQRDALAYAKAYAAHDGVIWETAIATLLRLQRAAGCHLHILHTQTSGSVDLIRNAKAAGQRVTCEINPWALFLGCDWGAIERLGSYALSYWVPEKNLPSLWEGLGDGTIDIVATDHAPHTREEKEIGWTGRVEGAYRNAVDAVLRQHVPDRGARGQDPARTRGRRLLDAAGADLRGREEGRRAARAITPTWCWSISTGNMRSRTRTCLASPAGRPMPAASFAASRSAPSCADALSTGTARWSGKKAGAARPVRNTHCKGRT